MNDERPIEMPNFLVDLSVTENLELLSDKQFRRLFNLMIEFAKSGNIDLSDEEPLVKSVFLPFRNTIEKGRNQYITKVIRNRNNAKNRKKNTNDNQSLPVVTSGNQSFQIKENKTKVNKTKQNVSVSTDTDTDTDTYSTKASPSVCPEGQPTAKPEYRELRVFAREVLKLDNAYFCDDFVSEIENQGGDWSDWQAKMTAFAEEHKNEWSYDG